MTPFHSVGLLPVCWLLFLLHIGLVIVLNSPIECQNNCCVWLPDQGFREAMVPSLSFPFFPDWMLMLIDIGKASERRLFESLPGGAPVTRKLINWLTPIWIITWIQNKLLLLVPWKLFILSETFLTYTNDENVDSTLLWIPCYPLILTYFLGPGMRIWQLKIIIFSQIAFLFQ